MRARQGQRTKGNNSAVDHANDQSKGEDGWRMDGNNNARARLPAGAIRATLSCSYTQITLPVKSPSSPVLSTRQQ